jgi:hypothetical protein
VNLHLQIDRRNPRCFSLICFFASRLCACDTTSAQLSVMMNVGTITA